MTIKRPSDYVTGIKYWQAPIEKENGKSDYLNMSVRLPYSLSIVEVLSQKFKKEDSFTLHELGCGWGTNLGIIHEHFPNATLTGNDVWKDAIAYIKENRGYVDIVEEDSADFLKNCIEQNKNFDVIITNAHLIHIETSRLSMLRDLHTVCKSAVIQENIENVDSVVSMKLVEKKKTTLPDSNYRYFFEV